MAERVSALADVYKAGRFGREGEPGVTLGEIPSLVLWQIAGWPGTLFEVGAAAARTIGADTAPGPGIAFTGPDGALLRVEPLKWWMVGAAAPALAPEMGTMLDISHSRTHLRVAGPEAQPCLNRLLPIDLRDAQFPAGSVASSSMHHVGVTLWRSSDGFELFLPRGFAESLWEILMETAVQFGVEVS